MKIRVKLYYQLSNYKIFLQQVDIYGGCGPLTCERKDVKKCWNMVEKDYFFYLSFENSLCKDYITEKFFSAMRRKIIPVVLGGSTQDTVQNSSDDYMTGLHGPPHSFIDVRKYSSPKVLAEYLNNIIESPNLYAEYFWWKEYYVINSNDEPTRVKPYCDMCRRLHEEPGNDPRNHKIIDDLHKYWDVGSKCQPAGVISTNVASRRVTGLLIILLLVLSLYIVIVIWTYHYCGSTSV